MKRMIEVIISGDLDYWSKEEKGGEQIPESER